MRLEILLRGPRPSALYATRGQGVFMVSLMSWSLACAYSVLDLTSWSIWQVRWLREPLWSQCLLSSSTTLMSSASTSPSASQSPLETFHQHHDLSVRTLLVPSLLQLKDFGPFGTRSKHKKVQKNTYLLYGHAICKFSGKSPLLSHRMTLNSLMVKNDAQWDATYLFWVDLLSLV